MRLYSDDGQRAYDIQPETLRRGGHAEVVMAYDDEEVAYAVKLALLAGPDGPIDDRWLDKEAELVRTLLADHPDLDDVVVPVVDQGEVDGRRALVMPWMIHRADEFVQGRSLVERVTVAAALVEAVARLQTGPHGPRRSVVHRDVKPSNAFVEPHPDGVRVWLADFGAARTLSVDHPSRLLTLAHTEGFAPVDQLLASRTQQLDPSWDVYAAAASAFELLTGQPLQAVISNYHQCTRAGRALRRAQQGPDDSQRVVDLERLGHLPFDELVHVERLAVMIDSDQDVLLETVQRALSDDGEAPRAQVRRVCGQIEQALTPALQPDPRRRDRDAQALADALRDIADSLSSGAEDRPAPNRSGWGGPAVVLLTAVGGLGLVAQVDWARSLTVAVDADDLRIHTIRVDGEPSAPTGVFGAVGWGRHTVLIRGDVGGRCPFDHVVDLVVPPGWGRYHAVVPPPPAEDCPTHAHGYATVRVPAAVTTMGGRPEEPYGAPDERPEHAVTLTRDLQFGRTEVTQALWRAVMGDNPVEGGRYETAQGLDQPCRTYGNRLSLVGETLPVMCVTWCDAVGFANRLSTAEGLTPVYDADRCVVEGQVTWDRSADGWRLPTEAEWDHAARAGGVHRFVAGSPFGSPGPACKQASFFGNVLDEAFTETFPFRRPSSPPPNAWRPECSGEAMPPDGFAGLAPVGSRNPNGYGLFDLTGNVREWTYDVYGPYGADPVVDPAGPAEGQFRTVRGSAFDDDPTHWMIANRMSLGHDQRAQIVGLRLVRNAEPRTGALHRSRSRRRTDVTGGGD